MPVEKSSSTCTTMRSLAHLSTCTKLIYLPEHALRNIDIYRKDKNFDLRALAGLICSAANSIRVVLNPPGSRFLSFLSGFAEGSPKVRFMSWLLAEIAVKKWERMVIYSLGSWQQFFWHLVRYYPSHVHAFHILKHHST
jgi:hypothetical protein